MAKDSRVDSGKQASTRGNERRRFCELCGCWVCGGAISIDTAWQTHERGIRHRRSAASQTHFGRNDLHVVSIFEQERVQEKPWGGCSGSVSSSQFTDVVPLTKLCLVVAKVCGTGKLYTSLLSHFTNDSSVQSARARLLNAVDAHDDFSTSLPTRIPPNVDPGDVAVAHDSATAHHVRNAPAEDHAEDSSSADEDEDSDSESTDMADSDGEADDDPQEHTGIPAGDTQPDGDLALDLDDLRGGLTAIELMLLSCHLPKHRHTQVKLPVQYLTSEKGAAATAVGLLLLIQAMRGCPALRRLSITFKLDEGERQQETRQAAVLEPVAHTFHRIYEEVEQLLHRCPALRQLTISPLGRSMMAQGNAVDLMLRLQAAAMSGSCNTRMAVLMGVHSRLGRYSCLRKLPRDVLEVILDLWQMDPKLLLRAG